MRQEHTYALLYAQEGQSPRILDFYETENDAVIEMLHDAADENEYEVSFEDLWRVYHDRTDEFEGDEIYMGKNFISYPARGGNTVEMAVQPIFYSKH